MSTMNISLPASPKSFVDRQVAERDYRTSSEYVRELIRRDGIARSTRPAQGRRGLPARCPHPRLISKLSVSASTAKVARDGEARRPQGADASGYRGSRGITSRKPALRSRSGSSAVWKRLHPLSEHPVGSPRYAWELSLPELRVSFPSPGIRTPSLISSSPNRSMSGGFSKESGTFRPGFRTAEAGGSCRPQLRTGGP